MKREVKIEKHEISVAFSLEDCKLTGTIEVKAQRWAGDGLHVDVVWPAFGDIPVEKAVEFQRVLLDAVCLGKRMKRILADVYDFSCVRINPEIAAVQLDRKPEGN